MGAQTTEAIRSPERIGGVLVASPAPADRVRLRAILSQGNWKLREAEDCRGALALLGAESVPVVLCERDHADGGWKDLLHATAGLPAPPNLIVFSRLADESHWAEVLNLGGFDVLMMPFDPEEVLRVASAVWRRWEYDFVARAAKGAARMERPAAAKAAPPERDRLPARREIPTRTSPARTGRFA